LRPAAHIGVVFGPFGAPGGIRGSLQASHFAQSFLKVPLRGTAASPPPKTAPLRPLLPPVRLSRKRAAPSPAWSAARATNQISSDSGSDVGSRRALVRFGLPAARQCFLALGALVRFGSPAARRFFSWLAALSLDLACLRRFLPWIGVLSFDLVLRFVFFLRSRRSRFCLLFLCGSWRVCVCLRPLSRVLLLTAHALFSPAARLPLFRG
jgi:hypothetical protein